MALTAPNHPPTPTLPVAIVRAALHRAEQPYWWFHHVVAEAGYGVLPVVWVFRCLPVVVPAWLDESDRSMVARFPFLAGRRVRS